DVHQGNTSVTSNVLTGSPNWTGGEVVIRKNYWITDRHPISGHFGGRINYTSIKESWYSPSKGFGFFIQNHIKTLDALGEWYYNPSTKNLAVYFGSTAPASAEVKVSTLDYLVRKANWGGGYLRFKNLHFEGANKDAFHMKGGKNVEVLNCDITYSGENGIFAEGALDYKVEDNTIRHTNNNAIKFLHSTHNSTFRNNIIEDNYLLPGLGLSGDGNGVAIFAPGNNSVFEYNSISRTGYIGIHFGGNNTLVKNNFVNYFCLTKNDGGGIYTYTGNSNATLKNRKVLGNIVLN